MTNGHELEPFWHSVPDQELDDLQARLAATRWPEQLPGAGWSLGTDQDALRAVVERWQLGFDWQAHEAWLNQYPAYLLDLGEDENIHLMEARSPVADALPLVLLHGWPSAVSEFRHVVEPLRDPESHGSPDPAFHVILVSLPGFGWGGPTRTFGWDTNRMADAIAQGVAALGIDRYGVFGTDAGAYVATALAARHPDRVPALHLQLGGVALTRAAKALLGPNDAVTELERQAMSDLERYDTTDSGYALINGTKPNTVGFALTDSPVGQAAWMIEKFHTWTGANDGATDDPFGGIHVDDVLAIISTFWFTRTASSAARFYYEAGATLAREGLPTVEQPTGCAVFASDIVRPSRRWADRAYPNITRWTEVAEGGHFSALQVPGLLVDELRAFFPHVG